MSREADIRALTAVARFPSLTDALLGSALTVSDVRVLLNALLARLDGDEIHAGIVPTIPELDEIAAPPTVREAVHAVIQQTIAAAIAHHQPKGHQPS